MPDVIAANERECAVGKDPDFGLAFIGCQLIAGQYPALQDPILKLLGETAGEDAVRQWARESVKASMDEANRQRRGWGKKKEKPKPIKMTKQEFMDMNSEIWDSGVEREYVKSSALFMLHLVQ